MNINKDKMIPLYVTAEILTQRVMQTPGMLSGLINELGRHHPFVPGSENQHDEISKLILGDLDKCGVEFISALTMWVAERRNRR